jgi:nudix-type nucleoside diphosphatase (YffH/AdpP family)
VRQFRYPVYTSLSPEERRGNGARRAWTLEIVAGVNDAGGTAQDVAHKELLEETGYRVSGELEPVASFYASPGGSSERITLFFARVDRAHRTGAGGGAAHEGEDIEVVAVPFEEARRMVASGEICHNDHSAAE